MQPETILEGLILYREYLKATKPKSAEDVYNLTLTALTRYTLPGWGQPTPTGRKPTKAETNFAEEFLKNAPFKKLKDALDAQEKVFDAVGAQSGQRYTYRSKLKGFLAWAEKQGLFQENQIANNNRIPKRSHGHGHIKPRLTNKSRLPGYRLDPAHMSASLKAEIEEFHNFMTKPRYPGRKFDAIKLSDANQRLQYLYRMLGWFSTRQNASENLSLDLLVPKVKLKQARNKALAMAEAQKAADHLDSWLCDFLDFQEIERGNSAKTLLSNIVGLHTLIRYQYLNETEDKHYKDIPAMKVISAHSISIRKKIREQKPVINEELKWLDLPEVFSKIVEPLRMECGYKRGVYGLRSDTTIARSFKIFLVWGLFTFRPPRRQQEWREAKFGLCCSLQKKPQNLVPNQFIHPLPDDRDKDRNYGYVYKDIDGKWYKDTTPESYKTGKTYGHQKLEIPNPIFSDGKCFYDYLEAFLYGYYRDKDGNWTSGGKVVDDDTVNRKGEWHNLRMKFNPCQNFLIVNTKGNPYRMEDFSNLFSIPAHRLSGKQVTPHILRNIYASYFLDQGYTSDQIASLAYALGHSEEMLRQEYDRRNPAQKNRPIEQTMTCLVNQFMSGTPTRQPAKPVVTKPAPDLDKILAVLTPEQIQQLGLM